MLNSTDAFSISDDFWCHCVRCVVVPDADVAGCGTWTSWSDWTDCTTTCDDRSRRRTRVCTTGSCAGDTTETESCPTDDCTGISPLWIPPLSERETLSVVGVGGCSAGPQTGAPKLMLSNYRRCTVAPRNSITFPVLVLQTQWRFFAFSHSNLTNFLFHPIVSLLSLWSCFPRQSDSDNQIFRNRGQTPKIYTHPKIFGEMGGPGWGHW